jgi:hypothetical protein
MADDATGEEEDAGQEGKAKKTGLASSRRII